MICGRIDSKENTLEKMIGMMEYNSNVLGACQNILLVLNRGDDVSEKEMTDVVQAYRKYFGYSLMIQPHPVGLGHQVGHVALDKTGYLFAKNNLGTKYTMKMCNDILVSEKFLNVEVEQADLYYLPAVATHDMIQKADMARTQLSQTTDYTESPLTYQSWFFIASNNTDVLYESDEEIERVFRLWDFNGDVKQSKVLCAEHSLTKWSVKNKLKRHSLYTSQQYDKYCDFVLRNQIYDGSLKNIMLEPLGITHYHFANQPLTQCNL